MAELTFPRYVNAAARVVDSVYIDAWIEDNTRWIRIDILQYLTEAMFPFMARVFVSGEYNGPWAEMEEYPWCVGQTADVALWKMIGTLEDRAEMVRGVEALELVEARSFQDSGQPDPPSAL